MTLAQVDRGDDSSLTRAVDGQKNPTLLLKLFKPVGTFSNLSIFNLSTSDHKFAKSTFLVSKFSCVNTCSIL